MHTPIRRTVPLVAFWLLLAAGLVYGGDTATPSTPVDNTTTNLPFFTFGLVEHPQLHGWVIECDGIKWSQDKQMEYVIVTRSGKTVTRSGWLGKGGALFQSKQAKMEDPPQALLYKGKKIAVVKPSDKKSEPETK